MVASMAWCRAVALLRAASSIAAFVLPAAMGVIASTSSSSQAASPTIQSAAAPVAVAPIATQRTRFVIALEKPIEFQVFALANPNRVVVDLPNVKVQLPPRPANGPVGLVRDFRGGLAAARRMRVVIDVTQPVIVEKAAIMSPAGSNQPPQLVLEIIPVAEAAPELAQAARNVPAGISRVGLGQVQPPLPRPAERPEKRAQRAFKPLIVLDPGHGGHDSGAMKHGTVEKEVVLAFAHVLRKRLLATGRYRVEMTRTDDTFVPLDERREFAEKHNAALFIAIHADYASSSARGATIYSLREAVASELAASARGEVDEDVLTGRDLAAVKAVGADARMVRGILSDLASRETQVTRDRTGTFVKSVIEFMGQSTNLMDRPDRGAAFAVLRTAKVPAVLIELAYVTNRSDAALLRSDEWRQKVARSITTAVENYFSHQAARLPL